MGMLLHRHLTNQQVPAEVKKAEDTKAKKGTAKTKKQTKGEE